MAVLPQDATDFWNGVYFAFFYSSDNSVFNHLGLSHFSDNSRVQLYPEFQVLHVSPLLKPK